MNRKQYLSRVVNWFSYLLLLDKLTLKYRVLLAAFIKELQELTNKELQRGHREGKD